MECAIIASDRCWGDMTNGRQWLQPEAQKKVERAIVEAEAKTAAEFVVTVRASSGSYRAADLWFSSLLTFVGLMVYIYHPVQFTDDLVPPALALLFLISTAFASQVGWLRRLLTSQRVQEENVRHAALSAFYEQGISVTQGRTGVLVYVSLLESRAEVVPDIGVHPPDSSKDAANAAATLRNAVREGGVDALVRGLAELSDSLGQTLPRAADDINELSNSVVS